MTRRVLVTGATGFIGQHLLPRLAEGFDEVHAIARTLPATDEPASVQWHQHDLMQDDPAGLMQQAKPTHLIHLAWITTPGEYWTSPSNTEWLARSKALFDAFVASGGQRIVGLGTCAEYDWSAGVCEEHTTPITPASIYGQSKVKLHTYLTSLPIASAWARVFWPYGPGEPAAKLTSYVARQLLAGEPAQCSAGTQERDFIYVGDVAEALSQLLTSDVTGPVNIGTGQAVAVRDIAETIGHIVGRSELLQFAVQTAGSDDFPRVVADAKRLQEEVGFTPRFDLRAGLSKAIDEWRSSD